MSDTALPAILFVDDEPQILNALRRSLHQRRNQWQLHFCSGAPAALELMEQQTVDVIITDMQMQEMDGAALLSTVKQRHPNTTRMMLTGNANAELILKNAQAIHVLLSKPASTELIIATIDRALQLKTYLTDPVLTALVSRISAIPSQPAMFSQITGLLNSDNSSLEQIGTLIAQDMAITSKVLQVVNSPFFGLKQPLTSVPHAITYLGMEMIQNLVLASELFEKFKYAGVDVAIIEELWQHARAVSSLALQIGKLEGLPERHCHTVMTAGLLHDIGKLILLLYSAGNYRQVEDLVREGLTRPEAELQVFGVHHGAVGAYLLALWGLPTALVECIYFHHDRQLINESPMPPAMVVHVADCLVKQRQEELQLILHTPGIDSSKVAHWQTLLLNTAQ